MYLTLIHLNLRNRRVQRELANRYELHRSLMHGFKPVTPPGERLLYRIENGRGATRIMIQTQTEPDWSFLHKDPFQGYLLDLPANPQMKTFEPVINEGQKFIFRLQANPTKRLPGKAEKIENKRVGLYKEQEQLAWLARKGAASGFDPLDVRVTNLGMTTGFLKKNDRTDRLALVGVQFDGLLEVTDSQAFQSTIASGIGSGKGFGFGMLSLARA